MPDDSFDAVIIGGGTKALYLAMYLVRYGGMSVGIFERRHEIGGAMATEETAAPGFRGNTHANLMLTPYHVSLYRDFPEVWDYGLQFDQYLCSTGSVFRSNNTCLAIYSEKHDPMQERSAKEIARFSEKDADTWLRLWGLYQSDEMQRVLMDNITMPWDERAAMPEVGERQLAVAGKLMEAGFVPDQLIMASSGMRWAREYWESKEMQYVHMRWFLSAGMDVNDAGLGLLAFYTAPQLAVFGIIRGGTHQAAHAAHQFLVQNGCKFFTHSEVEKVTIENGTATGIRLTDGSEIKARKMVVAAGMNPAQLCFDLIGREYIDDKLAKRVEALEDTFGCLMWYTFAIHEAPRYTAEEFNPDIHETLWLGLAETPDPEHIARECKYAKLGMLPPLDDFCPTVMCHSLVDPSYAPPGKHVVQNEQMGPPATYHTEREWLEIKNKYAEDLVTYWQRHAPNMTWDNIIGVDTNSPYDHNRMKNFRPNGTWAGIDRPAFQLLDNNRPTPELHNHRTPIKNLYATGGCWFPGSNMSSWESYTCYRVIANDLDLGKPWREPGKEEPDSLVEQVHATVQRARDQFKRDPVMTVI